MDDTLDFHLLNDFQRDFPLCPAPFAELASRLGVAEKVVLGRLENLRRDGKISRVGAVFAPKRIGASTLAAMAVPPEKLDAVAAAVNRFPEVNHNYEREHRYNLWFVVTAASEGRLQATLGAIEQAAGYPLMPLPLLEEFHIDLGFSLNGGPKKNVVAARWEASRVGPWKTGGECWGECGWATSGFTGSCDAALTQSMSVVVALLTPYAVCERLSLPIPPQ